jgi:dipeptidyl aminopeptidase/acylaminoacyl peptidase
VPPERFVVKAADGITDLWGTMFRPSNFDPSLRYPVLNDIYPGPQKPRAAPTIDSTFGLLGIGEAASMAELGFVVVTIDARGTPLRSKGFHDHSYGRLGDAGLDDHVAALRQLGERFPYIDLNRVGIYGHSAGAYAAVRAMLRYPDVFAAGVASSGNHDQRTNYAVWGEKYQGLVGEADYETQANAPLAANLRGRLLLIHGALDTNVTPYLTLQLVQALVEANKDFELLIIPGAGHRLLAAADHVARRRREFLVRNLLAQSDR